MTDQKSKPIKSMMWEEQENLNNVRVILKIANTNAGDSTFNIKHALCTQQSKSK
jgi:hypothetical protein